MEKSAEYTFTWKTTVTAGSLEEAVRYAFSDLPHLAATVTKKETMFTDYMVGPNGENMLEIFIVERDGKLGSRLTIPRIKG